MCDRRQVWATAGDFAEDRRPDRAVVGILEGKLQNNGARAKERPCVKALEHELRASRVANSELYRAASISQLVTECETHCDAPKDAARCAEGRCRLPKDERLPGHWVSGGQQPAPTDVRQQRPAGFCLELGGREAWWQGAPPHRSRGSSSNARSASRKDQGRSDAVTYGGPSGPRQECARAHIDGQAVRRIRRWHMVTIRAGREEIS